MPEACDPAAVPVCWPSLVFEDFGRLIQSEHRRARIVIFLLFAGMLLSVADVFLTFLEVELFAELVTPLNGLLYLLTSIAFLLWMFRAYSNLTLLGARALEYSPWWTVGGFLVPILSLFRPYNVMEEIWCASDPNEEGEQSWKWKKSPSILSWWWGLFLAMNALDTFQSFLGREGATGAAGSLNIMSDLLHIPAAVMAILVIRSVDARQGQGRDRLLSTPPPVPVVESAEPETGG